MLNMSELYIGGSRSGLEGGHPYRSPWPWTKCKLEKHYTEMFAQVLITQLQLCLVELGDGELQCRRVLYYSLCLADSVPFLLSCVPFLLCTDSLSVIKVQKNILYRIAYCCLPSSMHTPYYQVSIIHDLCVFFLLYRSPFRSCSVVQDEGLVCGRGADGNTGLSEHSTRTTSINL